MVKTVRRDVDGSEMGMTKEGAWQEVTCREGQTLWTDASCGR